MRTLSVLNRFVLRRCLGSKKVGAIVNVVAIPMWTTMVWHAPHLFGKVGFAALLLCEVVDLVQNVRWLKRGRR